MAPLDPVEILRRLDWTESEELEFKSAKGGLPKSLWETYSAMANTHGGVILLGVEDDGTVSGVDDPARLKKAFWDTINNRGKVNINLLAGDDVAAIPHGGNTILAIRVPQATRYQRPVFLGQNPLTGTFRRNFEGDYRCTEQEVGRMLSDRAEAPADSRILEHFSLDDLDRSSLQQYRQRFSSHKLAHPWLSEDDQGLLTKLGGWRRDRRSGIEGLTVAGLLMFGTDEAIREAVPQYQVDFREKLSSDPDVRWTDRVTIDGTWCANLYQFYIGVFQRLSRDLKLPFRLRSDLFRAGETVVHEAIREALVNALIHADYQGQGGIVIEKYPDRFEFSNPGCLLVSLEQLMRGNISECRNKALQTMFMMIGGAEKAGSGVDKILRGWESQHWRSPRVRDQFQPDRVQWMLPMISLIPEESQARLKALFGAKISKFTELEIQALVTADLEGAVDNARMRQITGGHAADMTQILQGLVSKRALSQEGQGRWTRYRLPVDLDSPHKEIGSIHKPMDSLHKDNSSVHKPVGSLHKDDSSPHSSDSTLDDRDHLIGIAAPARLNRRLPPQEMEQLILKLCRGRWLSRSHLADLLQRNAEGLRSRFITPMVEHGLLRLRHPDKPNRADQAYTAGGDEDEPDDRNRR